MDRTQGFLTRIQRNGSDWSKYWLYISTPCLYRGEHAQTCTHVHMHMLFLCFSILFFLFVVLHFIACIDLNVFFWCLQYFNSMFSNFCLNSGSISRERRIKLTMARNMHAWHLLCVSFMKQCFINFSPSNKQTNKLYVWQHLGRELRPMFFCSVSSSTKQMLLQFVMKIKI